MTARAHPTAVVDTAQHDRAFVEQLRTIIRAEIRAALQEYGTALTGPVYAHIEGLEQTNAQILSAFEKVAEACLQVTEAVSKLETKITVRLLHLERQVRLLESNAHPSRKEAAP